MRPILFVGIGLLILQSSSSVARAAEPRWIRIQTPGFTIYSTDREGSVRETLRQFERVRGFFADVNGTSEKRANPVRIVAFGSRKEYQPYRLNEFAIAYYFAAGSDDYIVMSDTGAETAPVAVHEYVHLIARHSGLKLPPWLSEGLAELYSTLGESGGKVIVGFVPLGRLQALRTDAWTDLATILNADQNSPYYNEKNKAGSLYNEGWALTHMLFLDQRYRSGYRQLFQLIQSGTPSVEALEKTYSKPFRKIEEDLRAYIRGDGFNGAMFDVKLQKNSAATPAEPAPEAELKLLLADLLNRPGREAEARAAYEKLLAGATVPGPHERLGYLDLREGKREAALAHFVAASELGSHDTRLLGNIAALSPDNPDRATAALRRLLEIDPESLEDRLHLASIELGRAHHLAALATLSPIRKVTPDLAERFFQILAYASLGAGDKPSALAAARRYQENSRDDAARSRAVRLIEHIENYGVVRTVAPPPEEALADSQAPAIRRRLAVADTGPVAPPPPPEILGRFVEVLCPDSNPRLILETPAGRKTMLIDRPDSITLMGAGAGTIELTCGPQKPRQVRVEYEPATAKGIFGLVRLIEFLP